MIARGKFSVVGFKVLRRNILCRLDLLMTKSGSQVGAGGDRVVCNILSVSKTQVIDDLMYHGS